MPRSALWTAIRDTLSTEIAGGHYAPGDKLPTEAALAARFGVNRHTIRRALKDMADRGMVHARRGAGVFVAHQPTEYPIGKRVRFHQNLAAAGRSATKRLLSIETRAGDARETEALALAPGALVHAYEGLSYADDAPVALARTVFPAARFPDLPDALKSKPSITAALASAGVADYTRLSTRISAERASTTLALHLMIPENAPVLRTIAISVDTERAPVEYGRTWFTGDRVTLTVEGI